MTDFSASLLDNNGLTEFVGPATSRLTDGTGTLPATGIDVEDINAQVNTPSALDPSTVTPSLFSEEALAAHAVICFDAQPDSQHGIGTEWFGLVHVVPSFLALGNILSTVVKTVEIFNSDIVDHSFLSFVNSAGSGISVTNLPGLPETLTPFESVQLSVQVLTEGPATINGTLDWGFDLYTVLQPVTGQRVIVFPYRPEAPLQEEVKFLTGVLEAFDTTEQRIKKRKNPRQNLLCRFKSESPQKQSIENLLFDWQGRSFGVPVWFEPSFLTVAAVAGSGTLVVDNTDYGDFRGDGGLVIVFQDDKTFDALEIDTITSTVITLKSPLLLNHPVGTQVMPLRIAKSTPRIAGTRHPVNLDELTVKFSFTDNDSNLGSAAGFNSLSGKVFFDDPNSIQGSLPFEFRRRFIQLDNSTGAFDVIAKEDFFRRRSQKGFTTHTRQQLFELRQVLHFLAGRQISFYLPTFSDDFVLTANLASSSVSMNVEHVNYSDHVEDRKTLIRVVKTDGTTLVRTIQSSTVVSSTEEQLTVDVGWPSLILKEDVERVEYIELARFDTDSFQITHFNALGDAVLRVPVIETTT